MGVSLRKGQKISLKKDSGALTKVLVGLGWDAPERSGGYKFDLDASAFLLGKSGKVTCDQDFIFYNNYDDNYGAVHHMGDNRTGDGDGDDEQITIDLTKIPEKIEKVVIVVTIHEFAERRQNFGGVNNAFIRIEDSTTGEDFCRFDLGEDFSCQTAIAFGEIYRHNGEWKFNALGSGYNEGLRGFCLQYGVDVE